GPDALEEGGPLNPRVVEGRERIRDWCGEWGRGRHGGAPVAGYRGCGEGEGKEGGEKHGWKMVGRSDGRKAAGADSRPSPAPCPAPTQSVPVPPVETIITVIPAIAVV